MLLNYDCKPYKNRIDRSICLSTSLRIGQSATSNFHPGPWAPDVRPFRHFCGGFLFPFTEEPEARSCVNGGMVTFWGTALGVGCPLLTQMLHV